MSLGSIFGSPNPEQCERWKRVEARGRKHFIWTRGVLGWGGFMFVFMTTIDFARRGTLHRDVADYVFYIVLNLLIWPLAGYVWGRWVWSSMEKRFSKS
jgi:hypothetical protein